MILQGRRLLFSFGLTALMMTRAFGQDAPDTPRDLIAATEKIPSKNLSVPKAAPAPLSPLRKNRNVFPETIAGVWTNQLDPDLAPEKKDSLFYEFTFVQDGPAVTGEALYLYTAPDGTAFRAHTRLAGTYDAGRLDLETLELVTEDSHTTRPNAFWCYNARIVGDFREEKGQVTMDADYTLVSGDAFSGGGDSLQIVSDAQCPEQQVVFRFRHEEETEPVKILVDDYFAKSDTVFSPIRFKQGRTCLASEADSLEIVRLAEVLQHNRKWKIQLDGYTEKLGGYRNNFRLSERRAETIKETLEEHGIPARRIKTSGHGPHDPVGDNRTQTGCAQNRRVEIAILRPD